MGLNGTKPALQVIGDYVLLQQIGEGGMGTVYKGRQRSTGRVVAVKVVLSPTMAENKVLMQRFEKEARVAGNLDHPNIIRALEYGIESGCPYLVMEFVEGESLGQRLERDGPLPEAEAVHLIVQAARALQYAHQQGLIHRDVKPDNIMVTPDGRVKLADLGLVKEMETDINLTRTGRGLGTPHFMAPEQFRNAKNADARCDVYSLAATLYQMVTGELPFKSLGPVDAWMKKARNELTPARALAPSLSARTDAAIRRAMEAEPRRRPQSCQEFIADLLGPDTEDDLWYVVYKDREGTPRTSRGTTTTIRRSLQDGLLGDASAVRGSRSKAGPFQLLLDYQDFKDLGYPATVPDLALDLPADTLPTPIKRHPNSTRSEHHSQPSGLHAAPDELPAAPRSAPPATVILKQPHIRLPVKRSQAVEGLKIFLLALLAMAAGLAMFMLFHK